jgi:hypothetical protein
MSLVTELTLGFSNPNESVPQSLSVWGWSDYTTEAVAALHTPFPTEPIGPTTLTLNFSNDPTLGGSNNFSQLLSVWSWSDYTSEAHAISPPVGPFSISLAGHDYVADTSFEPYRREAFRHRSIPAQREGILFSNVPGEGSVNPKGLWRRGQNDWLDGAGQIYLDRKLSVDNRFYRSKGVNPWTQWQLTLLNDVKQPLQGGVPVVPDGGVGAGYSGFIKSIRVGNYVYILTATSLRWTTDWHVYNYVAGGPIAFFSDICTDGHNIYISTTGAGVGIYQTTSGSLTMSQYVTNGDFSLIRWVNQRILAASGASIYNIIAAGPFPTALYTHPNPHWVWTDFTFGSSQIYAAGGVAFNGPSAIFRTTISSDGSTLLPPVQALPLETGEFPTALGSYLNFIFIGTNLGCRMCQTLAAYDPTGNQGDLRAGAIVPNITQPVTSPVTGFTANGRYVYFTWNNYDTTSTGLGRMDLENFIDALTPTYASDLMLPGSGTISLDWDPINQGPLMSIQGNQGINQGGVWLIDKSSFVDSGYVESGFIAYDLPDDKVAMSLVSQVLPPRSGTITAAMSVDQPLSQNFEDVGLQSVPLPSKIDWKLHQLRGTQFQVRFTLTASMTEPEVISPILGNWTLKSYPAISTGIDITCVLIMTREVVEKDLLRPFDPYLEYEYLEDIRQNQEVVQYVEGTFVRNVILTSLDWLPNLEQIGGPYSGYNAYLIVNMESLPN